MRKPKPCQEDENLEHERHHQAWIHRQRMGKPHAALSTQAGEWVEEEAEEAEEEDEFRVSRRV